LGIWWCFEGGEHTSDVVDELHPHMIRQWVRRRAKHHQKLGFIDFGSDWQEDEQILTSNGRFLRCWQVVLPDRRKRVRQNAGTRKLVRNADLDLRLYKFLANFENHLPGT
jgi:hypothetical protein